MKYHLYKQTLIRDAANHRIPILGEFELTARCNFNCDMCYVVNHRAKDLDTTTWITIFKQAVDAGLVFALLTGGELFVRQDAIELYNTLYDLGVKITVFTNGTNITDDIADALQQRPPEAVAITLYGASNETYQRITTHQHGFDLVQQGITMLQERNLPLILRTIPLKALYHDLDAIIDVAKAHNLSLHYLRYVGPTRAGCTDPMSMRLSPNDLIDFETRIQTAFGYVPDDSISTNTGQSTCVALKSGYFISYEGMMQPCAMAYKPAKSVLDTDVRSVFQELSRTFDQIASYDVCLSCAYQDACMQCYARRLLEQDAQSCPPYLRTYAILKTK